jgi:outer membrane protein
VAFRGAREEASLGARTTLDVLNAEQELLDARVSRISTRIDEQIASYSLLAAMGKLTATELDLGVKTYDPAEYYNLVKSAPRAKSKQGAALDRVLQGLAGN